MSKQSVTVKIQGQEYRIRSDADPAHLESVAAYVDEVLRDVQGQSPADSQAAVVLAALNIASEFLRQRDGDEAFAKVPLERLQALIDLTERG